MTAPAGDYERDENGDVVLADFHRRLPYWRCADCEKWLYGKQRHTLDDCYRNASGDLYTQLVATYGERKSVSRPEGDS